MNLATLRDNLRPVEVTTRSRATIDERARAARDAQADAIRAARASGVPVEMIAEVAAMSEARVYQLGVTPTTG